MQIKSTIFDSMAERELFEAIVGSWEPAYRLYPHIPFANLIELDPQGGLDPAELSFLHKTTVDYVLTDDRFAPVLGIEFDGLGHGRSAHGVYHPVRGVRRDPNRSWKLALKCRVAEAALFPFVVLSYDEKAIVDADTGLTIAHGIVGAFVAGRQLSSRFPELADEVLAQNPHMTPEERHDAIQDALLTAELDEDIEFNPIVKREIELEGELYRRAPYASLGWSYLQEPQRPPEADPLDASFNQAAVQQWWDSIHRLGVEVRISAGNHEQVTATWIRNYEAAGLSPFGWLDELAKVVAISAFLRDSAETANPPPN